MKTFITITIVCSSMFIAGCSSGPNIAVDPKSIKDVVNYENDLEECRAVSLSYDSSDAVAGSALLGAGAAVGTAALVLATGGLYLLPAGVVVAGAGGAAAGGGVSKAKESRAQEKIWADCMTERGYKAYTSN